MADDSNPFAAPTKLSNVVLIVDGKKLHVNKDLLASHSDVFYAMFFGDFAEKGKDEVELKDVVFEEFVDLLSMIHPGWKPISAKSVSHIMKLADQFHIENAREQAENFLLMTKDVKVITKLLLADQYNLQRFKDLYLESFTCPRQIGIFDREYARLSDSTKATICDKNVESGLFSDSMADDSNPFAAPTEHSNVVLIVDSNKLHVSKEFLAVHSPVFSAMFFGDFAEKGKEEVEIKDIVFEEFIDLLNVIYPGWKPITHCSVSHILKLADRFQIKNAREQAEHYLLEIDPRYVNMTQKLLFADQYNLDKLKDSCLRSFSCPNDMHEIKTVSLYDNFSDAMKAAICDRMMELFSTKIYGRKEHVCKCK